MSKSPEMNAPEVFSAYDLALFAREQGPMISLSPPPRLAVIGQPIAHSASPRMHNAAMKERGHEMQLVRILVTAAELPEAVRNLVSAGFLGACVTIPHKQSALPLMDEVDAKARIMGAVNTILIKDGKLHGLNTDGPGLSAAIHESFGAPLSSLRVLILGGAGGAGRAITVQCALEGCPSITIANRNHLKGDALASEIRDTLGKEINSISLNPDEIGNQLATTDLIINATPLGMNPDDPSPLRDNLLEPRHLVYDTVYSGGETALMKQAALAGARNAGGFSMLLHQGALQNSLWFSEPAPLETMREALYSLRG